MSAPVLDIDTLESESALERSQSVIEADKQCRISLSADSDRPYVDLKWNVGGRYGRDTIIRLKRGDTVVQPLFKTQVWFGPFMVPYEYAMADESRKEKLRYFWNTEKKRILDMYDYVRPINMNKDGVEPIGPHRFPDVTVQIIEADGTEHDPLRLHELYKIGDFDPLKDSFKPKESIDAITGKHQAELMARDQVIEEMRRELARVSGKVEGLTAAKKAS